MRTRLMSRRSSRTQKKTSTGASSSSVIVIGLLYISVAVATVGTRAYAAAGSIAPFAVMLSNALGIYGAVGTAILAVIIIFGTMNAYTTDISRVIYATTKH